MVEYKEFKETSRFSENIPKENKNISPVYIYNASAYTEDNRYFIPLRTRLIDEHLSEADNEMNISVMEINTLAYNAVRAYAHEARYKKDTNKQHYQSNQVLKKDFYRTPAGNISAAKDNLAYVTGFTIRLNNNGYESNITANKLFKFIRTEMQKKYGKALYNFAIGSRSNLEFTFLIFPVDFERNSQAEQMYAEHIYNLLVNTFKGILQEAKMYDDTFKNYFVDDMTPWYSTSFSVLGQKTVYLLEFTDSERYEFKTYQELLEDTTVVSVDSEYDPNRFGNGKLTSKGKAILKKSKACITSVKIAKLLDKLIEEEAYNWPIDRAKNLVISLLLNMEYQTLSKIYKKEFNDTVKADFEFNFMKIYELEPFIKNKFEEKISNDIEILREHSGVIDLFEDKKEVLRMIENILELQTMLYLNPGSARVQELSFKKQEFMKDYYEIAKSGDLVFQDKNKYTIYYNLGGDYLEGYALEYTTYQFNKKIEDTESRCDFLRPLTKTCLQTVLGKKNYAELGKMYFPVGEIYFLGKQKMVQDRVQEMAVLLQADHKKNGFNRKRTNNVYYSIIRQLFSIPDLISEESIIDFIYKTDRNIRYFKSKRDLKRFVTIVMKKVNSNNEYRITNEKILSFYDEEVVNKNKTLAPNLNGLIKVQKEKESNKKKEKKEVQNLKTLLDVAKGTSYSVIAKRRSVSLGTISKSVKEIANNLFGKSNLKEITKEELKVIYNKVKVALRKFRISFIEKVKQMKERLFAYSPIEEVCLNKFVVELESLLLEEVKLEKRLS